MVGVVAGHIDDPILDRLQHRRSRAGTVSATSAAPKTQPQQVRVEVHRLVEFPERQAKVTQSADLEASNRTPPTSNLASAAPGLGFVDTLLINPSIDRTAPGHTTIADAKTSCGAAQFTQARQS